MARNVLNDADVKAATVPEGKRVAKLFDGEGLELWVTPVNPNRSRPRKDAPKFNRRWRFSYRRPGGGRNSISLGGYPALPLAKAREKADDLRRLLRDGTDPGVQRKADKRAAAAAHLTTFNAVSDAWWAKQRETAKSESTLQKLTWIIDLVRPQLGQLQIGAIKPADVLAALRKVEATGRHGKNRYETTKRCRATLSRVFSYAVAEGLREFDPAAAFARSGHLTPPQTRSFAAITEPEAFGALLRAIDGYDGAKETRFALPLLALTALRPGELRQLRWSWDGSRFRPK